MMHPVTYVGINKVRRPIQEIITKHTGVNYRDILSKTRKGEVVVARHIFFYFKRKYEGMTTVRIGELYNRDHSTVVHACTQVHKHLRWDKNFRYLFETIKQDYLHGEIQKNSEVLLPE